MKKIIATLASVLFLNFPLLYGQEEKGSNHKEINSLQRTFVFDFTTKLWTYSEESKYRKGKVYFLIPYKSQPVISILNLQSADYKVKIEEAFFDVTPKTDDSIKNLTGEDRTTHYTQTMKVVDSDEVEYTVTITDEKDKIIHITTAYAKVYGGLKIDLSTGVLFHNLIDESYNYVATGNSQSSIAKDKKTGSVKPLFPVVLTHVYWRTKGMINPGFSLGFGIDDSGKAGYYLGPAFLLGDRQRAVISLGLALRPTSTLKGKYAEGQLMDDSSKPEVSDTASSRTRNITATPSSVSASCRQSMFPALNSQLSTLNFPPPSGWPPRGCSNPARNGSSSRCSRARPTAISSATTII